MAGSYNYLDSEEFGILLKWGTELHIYCYAMVEVQFCERITMYNHLMNARKNKPTPTAGGLIFVAVFLGLFALLTIKFVVPNTVALMDMQQNGTWNSEVVNANHLEAALIEGEGEPLITVDDKGNRVTIKAGSYEKIWNSEAAKSNHPETTMVNGEDKPLITVDNERTHVKIKVGLYEETLPVVKEVSKG